MIELLDPVTLGSAQTRSLSPVPWGLNPTVSFAGVTWKKSDTVWHRPLGNQSALESHSCVALSS